MNIEQYTSPDVFEKLQPEWNKLLQQTHIQHIFLTWEWQSTWWRVYRPGSLWVLAIRDDAGQLVGLAPWFVEERPDSGQTVRSIGCVDVTDYLELMAHKTHQAEVFEALAAYVAELKDQYDTIDLCNIPEESPVLQYFPDSLKARGFTVQVKPQDVCPVIHLPDSWQDYLMDLNKKQRHEIRRKMRRAEGVMESVDWYVVGSEHDLAEELDKFLALMRAASEEKAEFLDDERNTLFFREIVPVIAQAGWLQLAFLTVDGEPAAAYLNFDYNKRLLVYNSGIDLAVASHLSPGIVLLGNLIQDAIERQRTHFDFLRGDEEYKYRMGGRDTKVLTLTASR